MSGTQSITQQEAAIIYDEKKGYVGCPKGYRAINNSLRSGTDIDPEFEPALKALTDATERNRLPGDYIGFRKVKSDYLTEVLGIDVSNAPVIKVDGKEVRTIDGFNYNDKGNATLAAEKIKGLVGKNFPDKAFTSISMVEDLNYFEGYPVKFTLQMPKGTKGLVTHQWQESEFIAAKGATLEIIGVDTYHPTIRGFYKENLYYLNIYARLKGEE